jgi:hypothetical protein
MCNCTYSGHWQQQRPAHQSSFQHKCTTVRTFHYCLLPYQRLPTGSSQLQQKQHLPLTHPPCSTKGNQLCISMSFGICIQPNVLHPIPPHPRAPPPSHQVPALQRCHRPGNRRHRHGHRRHRNIARGARLRVRVCAAQHVTWRRGHWSRHRPGERCRGLQQRHRRDRAGSPANPVYGGPPA